MSAQHEKERLKRSLRATWLGLGLNAVLSVVKIGAGVLGTSEALIADGVESLADVISSLIVWRGVVVAAQPPDERHPYGHGKAEAVAAAVVGFLLVVAAGWIVAHAMGLGSAAAREAPKPFTLLVLLVVIFLKEILFRHVIREGAELDSAAVRSDAWHHRADAITSLAAGVGITVAILGGPAYRAADDVAAVLASGVIAWNGWRILVTTFDELMDASPDREVVDFIKRAAGGVPGVRFVEKCIVRKTGGRLLVDMHVHVDGSMSVSEAHLISHQVKDAVREQKPQVLDVLVHIEPALPAGAIPVKPSDPA